MSEERIRHHRWTSTQLREALAMRRSGKTMREIGAHFGLSPSRAQQVITKAERWERRGEPDISSRAPRPPANPTTIARYTEYLQKHGYTVTAPNPE